RPRRHRHPHERDAPPGRRSGLLLMGIRQLFLDDLPRFEAAQQSNRRRVKNERDRETGAKRDEVEYQVAVSSSTNMSRRRPCDAFTSTLSPGPAFRLTQ